MCHAKAELIRVLHQHLARADGRREREHGGRQGAAGGGAAPAPARAPRSVGRAERTGQEGASVLVGRKASS